MIDIKQGDCLELMKNIPDNSIDLIFCDPPYALGSEVIIKPDGKPDYKKAVDFMNKWDQPDGIFWEEWFCEAKRVLKHGGHCLMFGMDRQLWFNCYYANLSGFTQKQSLYWYFISNFPKASDLSKNLDKYFGAEREVTKEVFRGENAGKQSGIMGKTVPRTDITSLANTPLAIKYEGIKYSVAPLKQTNETIMVFQKPYKTGSCLHDVLTMENGNDTITCGGVDIEGNRAEAGKEITERKSVAGGGNGDVQFSGLKVKIYKGSTNGRFPAQTYIDSGASEIIDLQSGVAQASFRKGDRGFNVPLPGGKRIGDGATNVGYTDSGGASRILHKCDYELEDYDYDLSLTNEPKASKIESNKTNKILCSNAETVTTKENQIENFAQENVQENLMQNKEVKKLENYLSASNADWSLWITKQTELVDTIFALQSAVQYLTFQNHSQIVKYAVSSVTSIQTPIAVELVQMLICGLVESLESQQLIIKPNLVPIINSITSLENLAMNLLNVSFAKTEQQTDITQIITTLQKYISFVKVAMQKYIEEISVSPYQTDFDLGRFDLYMYQAKVSKSERNEGLEGFEEKNNMRVNAPRLNESEKHQTLLANNHPTVKPKALLSKILKLFKTPNQQILLDPFMGSGSMGISAVETGFDYIGYELAPDYFKIAEARIENAKDKKDEMLF